MGAETKTKDALKMVKVRDLRESPTNPRQYFDAAAMKELVSSVKSQGVLVPLLVRPWPKSRNGRLEIVAGARRYRAAVEAKRAEVPVRVMTLTDHQVLELQLIENIQRQDVHPLDEAVSFRRLLDEAGWDLDELCRRIDRSRRYVYGRMALANLIEPAKKMIWKEQLSLGYADVLCRLQPADQEDLVKRLKDEWFHSVGELERWVESRILRDLHAVGFPKDDATLGGLPACTDCPKHTGAAPLLFPELAKKRDCCADPACFRAKLEAFVDRRALEIAEAEGKPPLLLSTDSTEPYHDEDKPKWPGVKYYQGGGYNAHGWVEVAARKKPCDFARTGLVVHGHRRSMGESLMVCADQRCPVHFGRGRREALSPEESARRKRENEKRTRAVLTRERTIKAAADAAPWPLTMPTLQVIAESMLRRAWSECAKRFCKRLGLEKDLKAKYGDNRMKALLAYVRGLTSPEHVARFILELALDGFDTWAVDQTKELGPAVAILGVDVAAIAKEVDTEREAQLALKAQKAARRAEKATAKTKPALPKGKAKPAATAQEKKPQRRRSRAKRATA